MKITGYSQQVNSVSGASSANTVNYSAQAKAAASDALDLTPIAKGLGSVEKTISYIQEQQDNESVIKAMNAYNQAKFNNMYNDQNGVMNTQADGAANAVNDYATNEKQYRADILGGIKLHNRAKQVALDNMLNDAAQQGYQQVARHQYQQGEKAKDISLDNFMQGQIVFAQKNWNNPEALATILGMSSMMNSARYEGVANSKVLAEQSNRKYLGQIVGSVIDSAMQNEDYTMAEKYTNAYGHLLTSSQRASANKVIYNKAKSQWESNYIKDAYAKYGKNVEAFRQSLEGATSFNMGQGGSVVEKVRALEGKIPFRAEDGTNCVRTLGIALKGTPYEGQINTVPMIAIARKNNQLIPYSEEAARNAKPGDVFIGDGGDGDEIGHAVMKTERGTIQNGLSANGVYEKNIPPEQMLNSVKWIVRTSDYNSEGSATPQPMSNEEKDKLVKQFMTYAANEKRIKNMADDERNNSFSQEVFQWVTDGKTTMEQALAEARRRSGGDKDLLRDYLSTVHLYYNKANGGPGGAGSGSGAGKAAPSYLIDQAKTLLRNGTFNTQQEYVEYVGGQLGGNLNQIWKAREDYNDFKQSKGEFKFDLGNMVNGAMTDKFTGKDKLNGTDKAVVAAGVRMYVGKKIAEFRLKNKRDPEMTEVGPMIEEALTSNTFTYQTPGKYFNAWLTDNDFNLTAAELQTMGIDAIEKANGYGDLYNVKMSNGNIVQMNAARLYAIRNNQVNRG